jgi:DUF1009 family protein
MEIKTIGLIAGNNKFPFLFAKAARDKKIRVITAGIRGDTSFFLKSLVHKFCWFKVGELNSLLDFFKREGAKHIIMAGQVSQRNLFDENVKLDAVTQRLFDALRDRKADTIFSAIAEKLKENDLELVDSTFLLESYMAPQGTLTRRGPTLEELEDIKFGKEIAKSMGNIDVGQTVVIKDKAIVAIEAMEGTDQCILRGGRIAQKGAVVIKVSKPKQDQRFDIPVIGPKTIKNMINCNASCLSIEAGKTLIIDREICVKLANRARISIVSS